MTILHNAFWCEVWRSLRAASSPVSAREISTETGVTLNYIRGALSALQKRGLVRKAGKLKPTHWEISE